MEDHIAECSNLDAETQDMKEIRYHICFGQFFRHMDTGFYKQVKDLTKDAYRVSESGSDIAVYYEASSYHLNQIIMRYRNRAQEFDHFEYVDKNIADAMGYDLNVQEDRIKHWKNALEVIRARVNSEYIKTFGDDYKDVKFNLTQLVVYSLIVEKMICRRCLGFN